MDYEGWATHFPFIPLHCYFLFLFLAALIVSNHFLIPFP